MRCSSRSLQHCSAGVFDGVLPQFGDETGNDRHSSALASRCERDDERLALVEQVPERVQRLTRSSASTSLGSMTASGQLEGESSARLMPPRARAL